MKQKVVIIGGGISGLSAGIYAAVEAYVDGKAVNVSNEDNK